MKSKLLTLCTGAFLMSNMSMTHASNIPMHITAEQVSVSNISSMTQDSIMDNQWFEEMSYNMMSGGMMSGGMGSILEDNSIGWNNSFGVVTMDLGDMFMIEEVLLQVDSNDAYQLDYSMDNINWSNMFMIAPEDGEFSTGMDTMSSDQLNSEYVTSMDFSMVEARYLRVSASGGDGNYLLSELQAFGSPIVASPVPAPPSVFLFGAGLMMLAGLQYRRKKQVNNI